MKTVSIKSIVAALAGLSGAITASYYGYVNYTLIAGLSTFLFTLGIQYSSIKIKIVTSLLALLAILSATHFGN